MSKYSPEKYQRLKENKHKKQSLIAENASRVIEYMKRNGVWNGLAIDCKCWLEDLSKPACIRSKRNCFEILFPNPTVGDKVTLRDAITFTKKNVETLKADSEWYGQGTIVLDWKDEQPLSSTFTITQVWN